MEKAPLRWGFTFFARYAIINMSKYEMGCLRERVTKAYSLS